MQPLTPEEVQEARRSREVLDLLFGNPLGRAGALVVQMGQRLWYLREVMCGWNAQEVAKRLGESAESIERMDLGLERDSVSFSAYWGYAQAVGSHLLHVLRDEGQVGLCGEAGRTWRQERWTLAWRKWEERYQQARETRARGVRLWEEWARENISRK